MSPQEIHLSGVPEGSFAVIEMCGWCAKMTRCVHQVVYGGYSANRICGECGTLHQDGYYSGRMKSGVELERAERRIAMVAEVWKSGDQTEELWAYLDKCMDARASA